MGFSYSQELVFQPQSNRDTPGASGHEPEVYVAADGIHSHGSEGGRTESQMVMPDRGEKEEMRQQQHERSRDVSRALDRKDAGRTDVSSHRAGHRRGRARAETGSS